MYSSISRLAACQDSRRLSAPLWTNAFEQTGLLFHLSGGSLLSLKTTALEAVQRFLDVRPRLLGLVMGQRLHVRCITHDFLDLVASASLLDVPRKGPLTNTPVLDLQYRQAGC